MSPHVGQFAPQLPPRDSAAASVKPSERPDPTHDGKTVVSLLRDHDPSMLLYKEVFDTAGLDLAGLCRLADGGGKGAVMSRLSQIHMEVRPGHPRPRKRMAEKLSEACSWR